jgi:hypothetical protein
MNVEQLSVILSKNEDKELTITITGNNSFGVDITDVEIIENGKTLLLYENAYYEESGKYLLSPAKRIRDLLEILDAIENRGMQIKGRGSNMVLVSPTDCRLSWIDDCAALDLYDKSKPITIDKAKKDAQTFIESLHTD